MTDSTLLNKRTPIIQQLHSTPPVPFSYSPSSSRPIQLVDSNALTPCKESFSLLSYHTNSPTQTAQSPKPTWLTLHNQTINLPRSPLPKPRLPQTPQLNLPTQRKTPLYPPTLPSQPTLLTLHLHQNLSTLLTQTPLAPPNVRNLE